MKNQIAVIGECCLDIFNYGKVRLNPEAPSLAFTRDKKSYSENMGMASNVANHIENLMPDFSVWRFHQGARIVKARFVDQKTNQILFRVDDDNVENILPLQLNDELISNIEKSKYVVISDYCKGFLPESVLKEVITLCLKKGAKTFLDTKKIIDSSWAENLFCLKINNVENENNIEHGGDYDGIDYVVITRGAEGADLIVDKKVKNFPAEKLELANQAGLGDVFLAGLVSGYDKCKSIEGAIKHANICAGIAASKKNMCIIDRDELAAKLREKI